MTRNCDAIIVGDVVRHMNSGRVGAVIEIDAREGRSTIEYRVRPSTDLDEDPDSVWWSSAWVARVPRRDPYRRYLDMRDAEDDADRQARRSAHRGARHGAYLPESAWDKAFWRLSNLERQGLDGKRSYRDHGRGHWHEAALDCLERRNRSTREQWAATERRMELSRLLVQLAKELPGVVVEIDRPEHPRGTTHLDIRRWREGLLRQISTRMPGAIKTIGVPTSDRLVVVEWRSDAGFRVSLHGAADATRHSSAADALSRIETLLDEPIKTIEEALDGEGHDAP